MEILTRWNVLDSVYTFRVVAPVSWQPLRKSGNLCVVWATVYAKTVLQSGWQEAS